MIFITYILYIFTNRLNVVDGSHFKTDANTNAEDFDINLSYWPHSIFNRVGSNKLSLRVFPRFPAFHKNQLVRCLGSFKGEKIRMRGIHIPTWAPEKGVCP